MIVGNEYKTVGGIQNARAAALVGGIAKVGLAPHTARRLGQMSILIIIDIAADLNTRQKLCRGFALLPAGYRAAFPAEPSFSSLRSACVPK